MPFDQHMLDAMFAGFEWGKYDASALTVGSVFRGALPAAEERGYVVDSPAHKGYVTGYLHVLRNAKVWTRIDTNEITRIERGV